MKLSKIMSGFAAIAISLVAIATPISAGATSWQPKQPNIVQTAVADGRFKTLATALTCTDLAGLLQTRWLTFTVFAPTDDAFAAAGLNPSNVCTAFSKKDLRNILLYHVNIGQKDAAQVLSKQRLLMTNLQFAPITAAPPTIAGKNIIITDVKTSNGIIHVIDGVMIPRL